MKLCITGSTTYTCSWYMVLWSWP